MKNLKMGICKSLVFAVLASLTISCEPEDGVDGVDGLKGKQGEPGSQGSAGENGEEFTSEPIIFATKSALEPLVLINPSFGQVKAYSLLSTTDYT